MTTLTLVRRWSRPRLILILLGFIIPVNFIMQMNLDPNIINNNTLPWGPDFRYHRNSYHDHLLGNVSKLPLQPFAVYGTNASTVTSATRKHSNASSNPSPFVFPAYVPAQWPYLANITEGVRSRQLLRLWPDFVKDNCDDRILEQLNYTPPSRLSSNQKSRSTVHGKIVSHVDKVHQHKHTQGQNETQGGVKVKLKTILAVSMSTGTEPGQSVFLRDSCPVNTCYLTTRGKAADMDAVVFKSMPHTKEPFVKGNNSVWVWYELESPFHGGASLSMNNLINWTATYRPDSTIVTPYEKFVHFENFTKLPHTPDRNYAHNKTGLVAWFVSNCHDKNGRLQYAQELSKYIPVDIYGACGNLSCPRRKAKDCFQLLKTKYKFYLSFENSACRNYVTEKFFWNALFNNIVPIVMGASPEDYARVAPPHSYIHVDDFESPQQLASYLHHLNHNHHLYNRYFRWKGTGHFINTKFWCRLCAMLHTQQETGYRQWYTSVHAWYKHSTDGNSMACLQKPTTGWTTWRAIPYNYTAINVYNL